MEPACGQAGILLLDLTRMTNKMMKTTVTIFQPLLVYQVVHDDINDTIYKVKYRLRTFQFIKFHNWSLIVGIQHHLFCCEGSR
jgi:hypothetical protein